MTGHSIVVALFGIISDNATAPVRLRDSWLIPVAYAASLVLFLAAYYGVHAELFGHEDTLIGRKTLIELVRLFHVYRELHLRMNGAQHVEVASRCEGDLALRCRASGRRSRMRISGDVDISVVQQIAVVVDDLDRFTALDAVFLPGWNSRPPLWRKSNNRGKSRPRQQPQPAAQHPCGKCAADRTARARRIQPSNPWLPLWALRRLPAFGLLRAAISFTVQQCS